MKCNYLWVISCVVCFLLFFQGCKKDSFRIGILMDNYKIERWEKDRDHMVNRIKEKDGKTIVKVAQGDPQRQLSQAKKMIDNGVDALIVVPVSVEKAADIVEYAQNHDTRVIAYDRLIKNCDLDFYISFDNFQVGRLQAEYIVEKCEGDDYALINGPTYDNNSFLLRLGQLSVLQPRIEKGTIDIIYDVFVDNWQKQEGFIHMQECYKKQGDSIDAVLAGNDALARGCIDYCRKNDSLEAEEIYFAGQDAELKSCQLIAQGVQNMTVFKPIKKMAETAVNVTETLVYENEIQKESLTSINNNQKMVPALLLKPYTVHKDNIQDVVIESGHLSHDQIYTSQDSSASVE